MKGLSSVMKKILTSEYLSLAFRVYMAWVFLQAGLSKIPDPALFAENVADYRIIPYLAINLMAIVLPWMDIDLRLFSFFWSEDQGDGNDFIRTPFPVYPFGHHHHLSGCVHELRLF